jgi:hypothetical protein
MFAKLREKIKGWKTMIWNGLIALAPVMMVSLDRLQAVDLNQYMTWYMAIAVGFAVSAVGVWLRYVTTGPVGSKVDDFPAAAKAGD